MIGFGQALEAKKFFNDAVLNIEEGEYQLAIENFDRAIWFDYSNEVLFSSGYYNRGLAYAKLGNLSEAIANFTKAIKIKPDCC